MPLHNTIPLCNFKYAGDTLSEATFKYDTTEKINKSNVKLLYDKEIKYISKDNSNKYFYKSGNELDKKGFRNLGSTDNANIDVIKNKELNKNVDTNINVNNSIQLNSHNKDINISNPLELKTSNKNISINDSMKLQKSTTEIVKQHTNNLSINDKEIIKEKSINIAKTKDTNINIKNSIELGNNTIIDFNKKNSIEIKDIKPYIKINKDSNLQLNKEHNLKVNIENSNISLNRNSVMDINKVKSIIFVKSDNQKNIDKDSSINNLYQFNIKDINYIKIVYFLNRSNVTKVNWISFNKYIDRINKKNMLKINRTKLFYDNVLKRMAKHNLRDELDRIAFSLLMKSNKTKLFYRGITKNILKADLNFIDRITLEDILKSNEKYIDKTTLRDINVVNEKYINKITLKDILKYKNKQLNDITIKNIYKQIEKDIFKIPIKLNKEYDKNLNNMTIQDIKLYCTKHLNKSNTSIFKPSNYKYIEITKRWWWLNPTQPTDRLIIPNKDYFYNSKQLNNKYYEYLRFNSTFPIPYGKDWGVDWNIPPYPTSIEIMVDLTNIIISIWHKNIQGFMCSTGKEAMQFLMEMLFDWFNMDISTPNMDYYRAFRWIRWEAEKVYFLDTKNGLQAIGILVANLIDYLKIHHFDTVALWKNPQNMDIERQFNRIATNRDIMKDLDKLKGKRHYYIEIQNINKKGKVILNDK